MFDITKTEKGYDITLTRGDSLPLQLTNVQKNREPYTPDPADQIRFAMKRKYKDVETCLVKEIPPDTLILNIEPEDTKDLEMGKTYVYDIEITDKYGFVSTFIKGNFEVGEEVM